MHRGSALEFFNSIEDFVTEIPSYTVHEVIHFLLRVHQVVNIKEQVLVLEEGEVLGGESLFEVRHEVRVFQISAHMFISLNYQVT